MDKKMDKPSHDKRERKDKALPSPKNMRSPGKGKKEEKKNGNGRFNWGPVIDTTPLNEEECDDPRDNTVLQVTEYKSEDMFRSVANDKS